MGASATAPQAALDLLWVVNTPSFVQGPNVAPVAELTLEQVDNGHLARFLAETGPVHRVGRYFERLLHYWLAHVRRAEIVAAGLQIKDGKRTIGELDFLYRDERGQVVHCEASVKFFLHLAGHEPSEFPGPNATDNYERKTAKLFDKQLPLSEVHAPEVERREAFVKGIMFYRAGETAARQPPARLPAGHLAGEWLRESELDVLSAAEDVVFAVADKPHWLAPVHDAPCRPLRAFAADLGQHFASKRYPLMVSMRSSSDTTHELKRLFIVADDWPEPHRVPA